MPELYQSGFYNTGTASIAQGQTVVTGQGTAWLQAVRSADDFGKHVGRPIPIASVDSDTQITLAYPWPGPTQAAAPYRITFTPYHVAYRQALQEIGKLLASGNVSAFAGLEGAAGKVPLFTGAGTMEVTDLKSAPKAILGLDGENGKFPVFTGVSSAAARDLVGTVGQIGGIPSGAIFEKGSNANGRYTRFADGMQICTKNDLIISGTGGAVTIFGAWTFPAAFISATDYSLIFVTEGGPGPGDREIAAWLGSGNAAYRNVAVSKNTGWPDPTNMTTRAVAIGRWY